MPRCPSIFRQVFLYDAGSWASPSLTVSGSKGLRNARSADWPCMLGKELDRMNGLPEAGPEIRDFFHRWLETFSSFVRAVDYASAKPLFHRDILAFGTHRDVLPSLEAWVNSQ